jgi:hypothetical protein
VDRRKAFPEQVVADDLAELGPLRLGQRLCGRGQLGRAHVFGRRIDQVAHRGGGLGQQQATPSAGRRRQHQRRRLAPCGLVEVEGVAAEPP